MTIKEIIFDSPLYSKWENTVQIEEEDGELMDYTLDYLISDFDERVEVYCTLCESKRVFAADKGLHSSGFVLNPHYPKTKLRTNRSLFKSFRCSANSEHDIIYGFHIDGKDIVKISEYPSKYDSVIDNFNKYKKVIKKGKLKELAKASQLESYGYAIASFLYYRRIFEDIILQAFSNSSIENKIEETDFRKKRMDDKIDYVKEYLPDYFNENSYIYGTLSKGVHELEENECQQFLPIVKAIIFYSLDEAVDKRNKELRKEKFAKQLKGINTKLK